MKSSLAKIFVLGLAAVAANDADGKVTLPTVLSDNMVLQQQSDVKLWGDADPNSTVKIKTSWNNRTHKVKADGNGKWAVEVATPSACLEKFSLTFSDGGGESTVIDNVLIGEVWFCSGQSNMEMRVSGRYNDPVIGVGVVVNNQLNRGDNSCVETFCLPHKMKPGVIVEEGVAVRAIKRVYAEVSGDYNHGFEPKEICEIADGKREGDVEAARRAFAEFGEIAGDAMAVAAQLVDGVIVIGGGITAARHWILPSLLAELRSSFKTLGGDEVRRVQMDVFNLDDPDDFAAFAKGNARTIVVRGTNQTVEYDDMKRIGVTFSKLGASRAISAGAYAFALSKIDEQCGLNR